MTALANPPATRPRSGPTVALAVADPAMRAAVLAVLADLGAVVAGEGCAAAMIDLVVLDAGAVVRSSPSPVALSPVVAVVGREPPGDAVLALLCAGAAAVVSAPTLAEDLPAAVVTVADGGVFLAAGPAAALRRRLGRERALVGLTPREREALGLVATGCTHQQVARRMGVAEATVDSYVKRLRLKLGLGNKAQLTQAAMRLGLVEPA